MSDNPEATEAAETTEQPEAAGPQDPPPPTDPAEAAAAEEAAIRAELVAAARGEAPPPRADQEEAGEDEADPAETSQEESDDDSAEAAEEAASEEGEEAADAEEGDDPSDGDAAGAQDDIWANASDEQRAALEELAKKAAAAEQGKRSAEGRASGLKRRLDALMAGDGQEEPAEPETTRQPSEEDDSAETAGTLTSELKEFAEEYPEISKPILKALGHLEGEIGKRDAIIQRLENGLQQIGTERHQANLADQEQIVYEEHPDYDEVAGSDEFVSWMQEQSPAMQALIKPNIEDIVNGDDVSFIVGRYKAARGIVNGDGTDGASTAGQKNGAGKRKPAADPVRRIQRRSAAAPRSSPGAAAREAPRQETEEEVRREILEAERKKKAAEARA